jgi:hypothetical protein
MGRIVAIFCAVNSEALHWRPVGLRMIRLQQCVSGPYFTAFSLHIPDLRVKIGKTCARSRWVLIEPVFHYRTPKSDRRLVNGKQPSNSNMQIQETQ